MMANDVLAADTFAAPAFDQRWRQDEQITPNFWGPLALANAASYEGYTRRDGGTALHPGHTSRITWCAASASCSISIRGGWN